MGAAKGEEVRNMAKDKQPYTVELDQQKVEFLEEMAKKYSLPDMGKAMRCLIDHARENPALEESIFTEIRCSC
jgi:hypothetical protein